MKDRIIFSLISIMLLFTAKSTLACKGGQVLFQDNFVALDPAWGNQSQNLSVRDGKLVIQPDVNTGFVRLNQANLYNDIDACIKVSMAKSDDLAWGGGLVFWAKDESNYYALLVSGDGQFSVRRYVSDRGLNPVDWRENSAIKKGVGQINELRIVTRGNQATAYINGTEVVTFNGQPPEGGSLIGVKGSSAEKSQIVWEFSDLKITKPEQGQGSPGSGQGQVSQGGQVLYEDHFTTLNPGWGSPGPNISIRDGRLVIQPDVNTGFVALNQTSRFNDIDATIKVSMAKSDDTTWAGGLVFWAKDTNNYYALLVNGEGLFAVKRYVDNRALTPVDWSENASIKKGVGQINELRIIIKGSQATAYINGTQVTTFNGQPPDGGGFVGVKGSSAEKSPITWEFADLRVVKP